MLAVIGVPTVPSVAMAGALWGGLIYISTIRADKRRWQNRLFRTTRDALRGMQTIKAAAWEAAVLSHIRPFREGHLISLTRLGWLATWSSGLALVLPPLSSLAAVVVAYALGTTLPTSFIAFMNLFSLLRSALQQIATGKRSRRGAIAATGKIEEFIKLPTPARAEEGRGGDVGSCVIRAAAEVASGAVAGTSHVVEAPFTAPCFDDEIVALWSARTDDPSGDASPPALSTDCLVIAHRLSAKWSPQEVQQKGPPFMLHDLSFSIRGGGILGVSGPTVSLWDALPQYEPETPV